MNKEEKEILNQIRKRNEHLYCDKADVDFLLNLIDKLQKVINLMAQERAEICETKVSKEAIIDFYYKKVEEENEKK